MKNKLIITMTILVIAYPYILKRGGAETGDRPAGSHNSKQTTGLFSANELDNLLAPIALYPDPLLAQVLPAATFVDQITQAAAWLKANNDPAQANNQPWDTSVKALAGFPDVLFMMNSQLDWTTALGQAYVAQPNDVSASIQRLRQQARDSGALSSTPQQTVADQQGYVTIMPTQPSVVYVPQYDPAYVYGPSTGAVVASSLLSFGAGVALGSWWNNSWNRGWNWGGGGIYNINHNSININRNVVNRNINAANLNRFNSVHRDANWGRHARTAPGRTGAGGNLPGRPGTPARPGTPGMGGNRPNIPGAPGQPGKPGMGGNRPNIPSTPGRPGSPGAAGGVRQSSPGQGAAAGGIRSTPKVSPPARSNVGGAHARGAGGARRGGGRRR